VAEPLSDRGDVVCAQAEDPLLRGRRIGVATAWSAATVSICWKDAMSPPRIRGAKAGGRPRLACAMVAREVAHRVPIRRAGGRESLHAEGRRHIVTGGATALRWVAHGAVVRVSIADTVDVVMRDSLYHAPRPASAAPRRLPHLAKPLRGPRWRRLMRAANALRARNLADASGRCLALALDFSRIARCQGVAAELVVWSVRHDRQFRDHWAVSLGSGLVIDLTRVQVDGSCEMLHGLDSYPPNYRRPRSYPAALLLPPCEAPQGSPSGPLALGVHQTLRRLMLLHDLAQARSLSDAWRVGHSALSWARSAVVCAVLGLEQRLVQRHTELHARLQARA
jgi:hypothetical protein